MKKISLEKYFDIYSFLDQKSNEDFENYRKEIHGSKGGFGSKDIEEIVKYYEKEKNNSHDQPSQYHVLVAIKKALVLLSAIVGILVGFILTSSSLNINVFLLFSIGFPFLFILFSIYKFLSYKKPNKPEPSFFTEEFIIKKIIKPYFDNSYEADDGHNHVYYAYMIQFLQFMSIAYLLGVLVSSVIIFAFIYVPFHYNSTYNITPEAQSIIVSIISFPWSGWLPIAVPNYELISQTGGFEEIKEQAKNGAWAGFITMAMFFWVILPRLVLYLLATRRLNDRINQALKNKAQDLLEIISQKTDISYQPVNQLDKQTNQKSIDTKNEESLNTLSLKDYYILCYQHDLQECAEAIEALKKKTIFDNKSCEAYSFSLFKQEDKDIETLKKIGNKIVIIPSPQSIPDETFLDEIKKIFELEFVKEILVVPLDDSYSELPELNQRYQDYKDKISNLKNEKVSLTHDQ